MNDLHNPLLHSIGHKQSQPAFMPTKRVFFIIAMLLLVGGGIRLLLNIRAADALQVYTATTLARTVLTVNAKPGELQRTLLLPTSLRGNTDSVIYARSAGYLGSWRKGIGDQVKQGELLATIDAPEQEQELVQAKAQREQMAARLDFAQQTLARWESLHERNSPISEQDLAEKRSNVRQGQADLAAANANVNRLEQTQGFRRIVAPFAGIITRRSVEVGDLIASGGKELFAITQTDPLRLTVWVPQAYADNLKIGTQVNLNLNEQQGAKLKASIDRIAGGIDPTTRARQVDLVLPNPGGKILPGAYAEVSIQLSSSVKSLTAPAAVLIVTDQNLRVAVVDKDKRIAFRAIKLGRDLGRDVEILDGITAEDTLVVSPSDQLVEDEQVKTLAWQPTATNSVAPSNKTPHNIPAKEKAGS